MHFLQFLKVEVKVWLYENKISNLEGLVKALQKWEDFCENSENTGKSCILHDSLR